MALTAQQASTARFLVQLAESRGLGPQRAREFANAAFHESRLIPSNRNPSSGAEGLFQLLSAGYRQRARQLGGLDNPRANALAILPDYQKYWRQHPNAAPGQAAAAVEASGEPASWYAAGLNQIPQVGGGRSPAGPVPLTPGQPRPTPPGLAPAPDIKPFMQALSAQIGHAPNIPALLPLLRQATAPPAAGLSPIQARAQAMAPHVDLNTAKPLPLGASKVVQLALHYKGTPYRWGGTSPQTGFDCSGFVQWLYAHAGVTLPRTTYQQWKVGTPVARGNLRPGDILFFEPGPNGPGHEGLYIGNGQFIESPHTGASVRVSELAGRSDYMGARRVGAQQAKAGGYRPGR